MVQIVFWVFGLFGRCAGSGHLAMTLHKYISHCWLSVVFVVTCRKLYVQSSCFRSLQSSSLFYIASFSALTNKPSINHGCRLSKFKAKGLSDKLKILVSS